MNGVEIGQEMVEGGAPREEVDAWLQMMREQMNKGGAPRNEVDHFFGTGPGVAPMDRTANIVRGNFGRLTPDQQQTAATNVTEAFWAGLQYSAAGLLIRGRKPDQVLAPDAGLLSKLSYGIGLAGGDLPANIVGMYAGQIAGSVVGAPLGPKGMIAGSFLGSGAGGAALPALIREALMDQYNNPDGSKTWEDFFARMAHITKEVGTEAFTGALSMVIGGETGKQVIKATGSQFWGNAANLGSMALSATAIGGGLRGHVPDWDDFAAGTVLAIGLGAAGHVVQNRFQPNAAGHQVMLNLSDLFVKTGLPPIEAVRMAASGDLAMRNEILAPRNQAGEIDTPAFDRVRADEPANAYEYKPEINSTALDAPLPATPPVKVTKLENGGEREYQPPRELSPVEAVWKPVLDAVADVPISPETARRYGVNPEATGVERENAQRVILADLNKKYNYDLADTLLAYKSGVERADAWIAGGRDFSELPVAEQRFLQKMEAEGLLDRGYSERLDRVKEEVAHGTKKFGPTRKDNFNQQEAVHAGVETYSRWILQGKNPNDIVTRIVKLPMGGTLRIPEPQAIAGYVQDFARKAGFLIQVSPESHRTPGGTVTTATPFQFRHQIKTKDGEVLADQTFINIPDNNDTLMRRWFGLGRSEVIYHEVGHALDAHLNKNEGGGLMGRPALPESIRAEVLEASRSFRRSHWGHADKLQKSAAHVKYMNSPVELIADAFAVWLSNPTMRARMPEFGKLYGAKLQEYIDLADRYLPRRVGEDPDTGQAKWAPPPEEPAAGGGGNASGTGAPPGGGGAKPPGGGGPVGPVDPFSNFSGPNSGKMKIETDVTPKTMKEIEQDTLGIVAPEAKQGVIARWLAGGKDFIRSFEGMLAPAKRLDEKIGYVKPGEKTVLGVEDMMRMTYGSRGRAMQFIRYGEVDAAALKLVNQDNNYFKAFDLVREAGGTNEGFMTYRLNKRAVEKALQGIETGLDVLDAQRYTMDKNNIKMYEEAHQMIQRVHDGVVRYMVDSGLLSPERAIAMKEANMDYIVFRRSFDPEYQPPNPGRNFRVRDPNKKMTGDKRQIVDPISASIDNIYTQIAMADRNRALLNIKGAIDAYWAKQPKQITNGSRDNPYYTIEEVPGGPTRAGVGTLLDVQGNPISERAYPAIEPFLAMREAWGKQHPNDFMFFENGKLMRFRAVDPDLALLLRNVQMGGDNIISKAFIKFAGLERTGISAAPDYIFRSVWYGQLAKSVQAEGASPIPYSNMIKAGIALWTKNDLYQEFVSKGGFTAAMSDLDTNYIKSDIRGVLESESWNQSVANVFKHPIEALRMAQAGLDNMARIALMQDAKARGYSPEKAAMLSRKGHLDYGEGFRLQWLNTWSRMTPFMVTGAKDVAQVLEALNPKNGRIAGTLAAATTIYMLPTVVNYMVNYLVDQTIEDPKDRYENIDRWVKDMYWVLPPINGVRYKIPRGLGPMGFGFGTMPERLMDYWLEREGGAKSVTFKEIAKGVVDQVIPPFFPTLIEPAIDQVTGLTNNFSRRLIPAHVEKASGYMEYTHDTSETAKALTKLLGPAGYDLLDASPIVVENYAKKWLGTVPMEIAKIVEGYWKERTKPNEGAADTPFLRAFVMRRNMGGAAIDSYYTEFEKFTENKTDLRLAIERGDLSLLSEPQQVLAAAQLGTFHRSLREQRAAIEAIYHDNSLTDREKIKFTDEIATGYVATAQAGLLTMRSLTAAARGPADPLTP